MDGRNTINTLLRCHFRIPDNTIHRLNTISNFLLRGLEDPDHEKRLNHDTMGGHINVLARVLSAGNQNHFPAVKEDLLELITNWWNTAKWARRQVRIPMEKSNLLGDLIQNIVQEIKNHFGEDKMRQHYKDNVLEALIQLHTTGYINDPFLEQQLPQDIDLQELLRFYRQLATRNGFDDRTHLLLQLLREKKNRNENIHSNHKVKEYRKCSIRCQVTPSFNGYIAFRGLNIDEQFFDDLRRLFQIKYQF